MSHPSVRSASAVRRGLKVSIRTDSNRAYVAPSGEIDLSNASQLYVEVDELRRGGHDDIALDFRKTRFIDSTVIRAVLDLTTHAAQEGWTFGVVPGPRAVQRVFEIAGILDRLTLVEPPLPAAA